MRGLCLALTFASAALAAEPIIIAEGRFGGVPPTWSPDGGNVAYVVRGRVRELWVASAQGGERRKLLNGLASRAVPRWSPGGKRIAVTVKKPARGVVLVDVSGKQPARLLGPGGRLPRWRPDGKAVAYTNGTDVFIAGLAGKTATVTKEAAPSLFRGLAWSPDGRSIASDRNGDVMVVAARKGARWRLVASHGSGAAAPFRAPAYSADGKHIYFTVDRAGVYDAAAGSNGVSRVSVKGGKIEEVCDGESWSLVGSSLAVVRGGEVVVRDLKTDREREIAKGASASLAPGARRLACTVEADTNRDGLIDFRDRQGLVVIGL